MFIVIYNKQTKYISQFRHDCSTGNKPTPQWWLEDHCETSNLDINNFSVVTIPFDKKLRIEIGRDCFDEATNTVYADPDWVAPVPTPAPTE